MVVTDNGSPKLSANQTFNVVVLPRPVIQSIELSNAFVTLVWNSISGETYRVESKLDVSDTNWSDILPDVLANGPVSSKTTLSVSPSQEFYRVRVLP